MVLALAALASACGGPSSHDTAAGRGSSATQPVPATTDATCADLVVIGARGSTQNPDLNEGVGTEVRVTAAQLVRRLHRRTDVSVRLEAIRYDAGATATQQAYLAHTAEGSRMMTARLEKLEARCPSSRFALLGFSQGAQLVHGAATQMSSATAERVVLVGMIADPLRNPSDRVEQWSYAGPPATRGGRLGAGPAIDADLRDVAISLCVEGDEICNDRGAPGSPPSDTHKHFYETSAHARETAARLDAVLRRNGI
jgi:predicted esterase